MGELEPALDALAADDLHALGAGGLLDRTAELVRAANRIQAELARTVRIGDLTQAPEHDGQKTMRSWLRGHCRLSPGAAGQVVRAGRVVGQPPAGAPGVARGEGDARPGARGGPGGPRGGPGGPGGAGGGP